MFPMLSGALTLSKMFQTMFQPQRQSLKKTNKQKKRLIWAPATTSGTDKSANKAGLHVNKTWRLIKGSEDESTF